MIISQGKSDNFGDTQTYAQFAADYPTWFMTLTECSDNEQFNSNRDCPKQEIVNEFKLERHPTRNKIFDIFAKIFKVKPKIICESLQELTFIFIHQIQQALLNWSNKSKIQCLILKELLDS